MNFIKEDVASFLEARLTFWAQQRIGPPSPREIADYIKSMCDPTDYGSIINVKPGPNNTLTIELPEQLLEIRTTDGDAG